MKEAADGVALAPILSMVRREILDPHIHGRDTGGRSRSHSLSSAPSTRAPSRSATPARRQAPSPRRADMADASKSPRRRARARDADDFTDIRRQAEGARSRSVGPRGAPPQQRSATDDDDSDGHVSRASLQPTAPTLRPRSHLGRQRHLSSGD